ncbi:MAG TPA: CPBP family intramembrane metalloprotease [Candidatus Brocadiia bacterium]|nr:CPBP family intramembrane metalloprotease [Candidatus Brocadiia bacterium]
MSDSQTPDAPAPSAPPGDANIVPTGENDSAIPPFRLPEIVFPHAQWPLPYAIGPVLFMLLGQVCVFGVLTSLRSDEWMEAHKALTLTIYTLSQLIGIAAGLFWLVLWKKRAAHFLALDKFPAPRKSFFYAAMFLITFPAAMALGEAMKLAYRRFGLEVDMQDSIRTLLTIKFGGGLIWLVFLCAVIVPAMEEIIFRGFFYAPLANGMGRFPAALIVSAVFAVLHGELGAIAPIFVLSLLLCFYYSHSGSLWLSIIGHSMFNAVNIVLLLIFRDRMAI